MCSRLQGLFCFLGVLFRHFNEEFLIKCLLGNEINFNNEIMFSEEENVSTKLFNWNG